MWDFISTLLFTQFNFIQTEATTIHYLFEIKNISVGFTHDFKSINVFSDD